MGFDTVDMLGGRWWVVGGGGWFDTVDMVGGGWWVVGGGWGLMRLTW